MTDFERELTPPPPLKRRVIRTLRQRGLLRSPRASWWGLAARLAAAVALFAAGALVARRTPASPPAGPTPRWVLLLYEDDRYQPGKPGAEVVGEYAAWARRLWEEGRLELGEKLDDAERSLGPDPAGPARSSLGTISGLFIIRAASWEEAAAIGRTCPHLRYGGRVVIRRIESA